MFTLLNLMDALEAYDGGQHNLMFIDDNDHDDLMMHTNSYNNNNLKITNQISFDKYNAYLNSEVVAWHMEQHDEYLCVIYHTTFED